ncbi:MAG: UDP-N-acetylmuramoyl-tripeptide--D-alanyl-D-alanine ligase [Bacteroidota bacterium]
MNTISIDALYNIYLKYPNITTDTRQIKTGDLFFALKGPSFNANQFAYKALEQGAAYAIVDEPEFAINDNILYTKDVLSTLQQLAKHHRKTLNIPLLAITGSNGKTTTKELVHAVLSSQYRTYTTTGNLNNHIGIPLTLLKIKNDAEIAVVEMGANHQQEIASYCEYTLPTLGMITNCGKAHLEGFGGIEGVIKGKGELFDYLKSNDGEAFACSDFDYFKNMSEGIKTVHWYGTETGEVTGHVLQNEPFLRVELNKGFDYPVTLHTNLVGKYNVYNVLAACVIGKYFKVSFDNIQKAIESYEPTNNRSQLIEKDGDRIILDAYNANPTSMQAAIENFAAIDAGEKILFLGGMMELGDESLAEHRLLLDLIAKYPWKQVVLVGGDFARLPHSFLFFEDATAAAEWWKQQQHGGNYLLVKGSRSIKMEKIVG